MAWAGLPNKRLERRRALDQDESSAAAAAQGDLLGGGQPRHSGD